MMVVSICPRQGTAGASGPHTGPRWWLLWCLLCLLAFLLASCSDGQSQVRVPLAGPGLYRTIAGGSQGQGTLRAWWLPASARSSQPRVLLWDGTYVAVVDPSERNALFTPLQDGLRCAQVALAPDNHAFACSQTNASQGTIFIKSLDDLSKDPQRIALGSAPFSWAPDSRRLVYVHTTLSGAQSTCSVQDVDTFADALADHAQVLLSQIPFNTTLGETASSCPVAALAVSPAGDEVAATLATAKGVNLELLRINQAGASQGVRGNYLLPGIALQAVDTLATASLFWSPDGTVLAALVGYQQGIEDGLYVLPVGASVPRAEPHLTDVGEGAALAFSPDSRWLAVGTSGHFIPAENASLQVYDLAQQTTKTLGEMLVVGPDLGWSPDGATLAAASAAKGGIVLWSWPDATLKQVVADRDVAHLHQLAWSPDSTSLLFSEGAHANGLIYDELYVQAIPVPPGQAPTLVFPGWFAYTLGLLPKLWLIIDTLLFLLVLSALLMRKRRLKLAPRARVLVRWALVVGSLLGVVMALTSGLVAPLLGQFYRLYSPTLCQSSPTHTCTEAGALSVLTVTGPLAVVLAGVVFGALLAGRRRPKSERIVPRPIARPKPPVLSPAYDEPREVVILLPPAQEEREAVFRRLPDGEDNELPEQW